VAKSEALIPSARIERAILSIRGHNVMLDSDLAEMYGVPTKVLNQAVRRNLKRFPGDFMFQLAADESASLRSQSVTSKLGRGGRRYRALAFTEQGVAMLSTVLNSERAVEVNIAIMRAFVRLREILSTHKDLARKLEELEKKYDENFRVVFDAIRQLMAPPPSAGKKGRIGFHLKVVIVDDVVTTGGSSLQAIDRIEEFGCEVVAVAAIVDRLEGGAANFAESFPSPHGVR
jgi:hypothetical protein